MNVDTSDTEDEPTPSVSHRTTAVGHTPSPMAISLDDLPSNLNTTKMFAWTHHNGTSVSAPLTSHVDHVMCPTYGHRYADHVKNLGEFLRLPIWFTSCRPPPARWLLPLSKAE